TASLLFDTIRTPLTLIATILLVYITAEIVWRERTLRFSGILDATPASNATFVLAKCAAAIAMVLVLTAVALVAGAVLQLAKGWAVEPLVLLSFAYFLAAPLVLFAILAIVVQTLSPHKYAGMFFVLLLAMVTLQGARFGLEHPLLRFASTPPTAYSDFNGFGDTSRFHLFVLYWSALAALLLLVAIRAWRQGTRERIPRPLAALFATIFVATGAFLFHDTDTEGPRELRANYEKRYKRLAALPVPRIAAVRARIDLDGRRYRTRGEYVLVNRTAKPIDTVLVSTRERHHVLALREPLLPSQSIALKFDFRGESGYDVYSPNVLPHIGYREGYELDDPRDRRRHGLPPANVARAEHELPSADWSRFDVTISTRAGETAVAPGRLVRDWRHGGRHFFHYRTDGHAPHRFAIASAHYAVRRATHHGIPVEIYHHPAHVQNVPRMLRAATESLRTFEAAFGTYTHPQLRIAEIPVPEFSGYAYPGMVLLGEKRGFLVDARDPRRLDLVTRRTAHEVAHQWWGYTLLPASAPGASMLMESLTKYAELVVLEKMHGREQIRQSLAYELDRYLKDRTAEDGAEPPLARVGDQAYLYYRKGAIVMYALRDLLGERAVNTALRNLMREQSGPQRTPTSAHLVAHLRAVTPHEHHSLLNEWIHDVVLYDLALESATTRRVAGGRYEVTMRIRAAKQRDDDTRLPMHDPVDVGVFAADDTPLYLARHTLRDGQQLIRVIVAREPRIASVDPYLCRIDRNRFDNTRVSVTELTAR
ncbi:MAG TPA: M1 family aminopeptidase, partial [Thermoanaerobaculia bacterium]|nr:M1 family aminopeptidase [Thermoanaerobaculia bacterium]